MVAKKQSIYEVRITLRGSKPPIWRRVATPSDITLGQLHEVIQIAMGWTDSHMHQFILPAKAGGGRLGAQYFVTKVTPWGDPTEMEGEDENVVTLAEVCRRVKSKLIYEYDFGDGWEHIIEVQKIVEPAPGVKYPVCLAGKKSCPPEDCGGVWGYYNLLHTVSDPKREDHEEMVEWLGDGFDPDAFNLEAVNAILAKWRKG